MSQKIGEILIEKRLITRDQLERALRAQLILGGHLGTCLIEAGFIDEDALGRTLAEVYEVPYAPAVLLHNVPATILETVPRRLVEEYRVVPIGRKDNVLDVAMVNPSDLTALDGLAFATGCRILPWVTPEIRVLEAMETHYGVPRGFRHITICLSMDSPAEPGEGGRSALAVAPGADADVAVDLGRTGTDGRDSDPNDLGGPYGYGRSWIEIADELCRAEAGVPVDLPARLPDAEPVKARREDSLSLVEVAERLCRANSKGDIAETVLGFASATMERSMLLAVHGAHATVWSRRGFPQDHGHPPVRFSVISCGLFELLLGNEYYRGPLGDDPRRVDFFESLKAEPPAEALLVPAHLNDRLVAFFYGDGGPVGSIGGDTQDYLRLVRMMGLSLSLLLLKRRIRTVASFADQPAAEAAGVRATNP